MTTRLAVLASGGGSNLQAIIDACSASEAHRGLDAEVVLVVVNRAGAGAAGRAAAAGVPAVVLESAGAERGAYDTELAEVVAAAAPDWVVLAGWMRLLTMNFLGRFPGRVVNLHPALPGQFPGTHAIERAFAEAGQGRREHTGVMVHLVPDEGVDDGPVLATATVPILPGDTLDTLTQRVHATEHELLVSTLRQLTRSIHAHQP